MFLVPGFLGSVRNLLFAIRQPLKIKELFLEDTEN